MKVKLERPRPTRYSPPGYQQLPIVAALPFWWSRAGSRCHRIRFGWLHCFAGQKSHASYTAWCGQSVTSNRAVLCDEPPADLPFCATCEGRAIGAGQLGAAVIAGRSVIFSPRGPRKQLPEF